MQQIGALCVYSFIKIYLTWFYIYNLMIKTALILLLLCFGFTAKSQRINPNHKWQIAPELGGNLVQVEKDTFGGIFQPTFYAGPNITYNVNSFLGVRSGVFFTQKKHTYSESDVAPLVIPGFDVSVIENVDFNVYNSSKHRITQYYLEVPLMAVLRYKKFNFYTGPNFSYMLFARTLEENITEIPALSVIDFEAFDPDGQFTTFLPAASTYELKKTTSTKDLNSFDFSVRGGVGVEMDRVGINLFYNYSFLKYRNGSSNDKRNYRYFQATVSYNFDLKRR